MEKENENYIKKMKIQKIKVAQDFQKMFKDNKTLIHMDLSHNNFCKADCEIIDEGLKENHTLYGIHMVGNELNTNSLGFFKDGEADPSISHIIGRIKPTLQTGTVSKQRVELKASSNCWICEGWS